jgi:hypothetical protein
VPGEEKEPDSKQTDAGKAGGAPRESPWPGLLKGAVERLVPLLLTGASLIGFVAFAGAVIVWTRFDAIEVPPDQAVKAVPQSELVATGSSLLLIFGFFGVLAIVAAYLIDRRGRATPGMSRALLVLLAVEGGTAIRIFDDTDIAATVVFVLIALLALAATFHRYFSRYVDELPSRPNEALGPTRRRGVLRTEAGELRIASLELAALAILAVAVAALGAVLILVELPGWLAGFLAAFLAIVAVAFLVFLWRIGTELGGDLWAEWKERRAALDRTERRREEDRQAREKAARERLRRCEEGDEPTATAPTAAQRICDCAVRLLATARGRAIEKPPQKSQAELEREREAACAELREEARTARRRPHRLKLTAPGVVWLIVLGIAAIALPCAIAHNRWLAVPLGTAMVLGLGLWRIAALSKSSFIWYGLLVFLSVPLFGTLTLMAHNVSDPQVQPVALIRSTDGPDEAIQGIYVTEGSERVYFANVATEGCSDNVTPDSGRLLWVPKSEVVAMSIGRLQSVEEAGRSALEMAYALTPSVETPEAGAVSLAVSGKKSKKFKEAEEARELAEAEKEAPSVDDRRLENPGPAVRPNFGTGLSLVPPVASPGKVVELRLAVPNEDVNGFGAEPHGHTLRLNGVPLPPIREATPYADQAEYVRTEAGVLLSLDKRGVYGLGEEGRPYPLGRGYLKGGPRYVKLEDPRAEASAGDSGLPSGYLQVRWSEDGIAELDTEAKVSVGNGEPEALKPRLLRQAWQPDRIRFRVPDTASSGVVTLDCGQLAGSPFLRVSHAPTARIEVRMHENSTGITLDGRHSHDEDGEKVSRRWTIEGLGRGHRRQISARFPPRLGAYTVKLTVTDEAGNADTAELRLLRLPTSLFALKRHPEHQAEVKAAARALDEEALAHSPQAIELDGHTDQAGPPSLNMKLAFERDDRVDEHLLLAQKNPPLGEPAIPVRELAYGRTCPIDPRSGSRPDNRRVDVLVLDKGVTVKPPKECIPGRLKKTTWHPRLSPDAEATSGGIAPPPP